MDETEITDILDCVVEMTADAGAGMVPLSPSVIEEITQGDDNPRFATFVIESGWSKSKRLWPPEIFDDVAEQINNSEEPIVGYLGHIRPDDDPYSFPEIQLHWLKARVTKLGDKARLAVKAYVLPGTKGRDYLQRRLVKTVSWRGQAAQTPHESGVKVTKFNIESIDLSRPRAAGMSARLVALTSEMEGGNSVKPEEIAALQENELRAHAPTLVATIETNARKPLEDKVSEMETAATAVKPTIDLIPELRRVLGISEDKDEVSTIQAVISHLKENAKSLRERILDGVLDKRLKGGTDADRALVRRILVGEMASREIQLSGDDDKDMRAVSEMVTEIIDGDESLKKTVSEMESAPPSLPTTQQPGQTSEWKPGTTTANVRVKARV